MDPLGCSHHVGARDLRKRRVSLSGSKAQNQGDTRNSALWDAYVCAVVGLWGPESLESKNLQAHTIPLVLVSFFWA